MDRTILGLFLLALGSTATADAQVAQAQVTDTYPFTQCFAVTSTVGNRVWTGTGTGVYVFDAPSGEPTLAAGVANQLRPSGIVREIAATEDHLYVAAGRAGLVRFRRDHPDKNPTWAVDAVAENVEVWAIDVPVRLGTTDIVLMGTNDGSTGSLRLLHASATSNTAPFEWDSVTYSAPVYALASRVSGNTLTLLVGTACGAISSGGGGLTFASLYRHDVDLSSGPPTAIPSWSATWTAEELVGSVSVTAPTFVRDIAIEPDGSAAYVAAFTRGVHKLDLSGSGLSEVLTSGWPLRAPNGLPGRADGVAVHDGALGHLLAVTFGPRLRDEQQVWGDICSAPVACDDPMLADSDLAYSGVRLYDLSSGAPALAAELPTGGCSTPPDDCLKGQPQKVALREIAGPALLVDLASETGGYELGRAEFGGGGLSLARVGAWSKHDDNLPLGSNDDMIQIEDSLVVGFESGIAAYDLNAAEPLDHPVDVVSNVSAILLTGFEAVAGYPAMVFGSAQIGGSNFFEVAGAGTSSIDLIHRGALVTNGRVYGHFALDASRTPDGTPWLIILNNADPDTTKGCPTGLQPGPSVIVYRLNTNASNQIVPRLAVALGRFLPKVCETPSRSGYFLSCHAQPAGGNDVVVWVGYGPINHGVVGSVEYGEPDAGLLVLKATFQAGAPTPDDDRVGFTYLGKSPAMLDALGVPPGRITFDPASQRVYGAFGCNGLAAWEIASLLSVPSAPSGTWTASATGAAGSLLQPVPGPTPWIYVTDLGGRVWVLDGSDVSAGPVGSYLSRGQPNALWPADSTVGGSPPPPAFFLADGRGGLHRLQFTTVP